MELAILLPLLMLILLGCIDLGRAFSVYMTLANGSREGARYAALHPKAMLTVIEAETRADIVAEGLSGEDVTVVVSTPEDVEPGDPISVTAQYSLQLLVSYLFGGQPVTIRATTQMVIIGAGT